MIEIRVHRLDWDSDFMGFQVGRLYGECLSTAALRSQLNAAREEEYRLLYWSVRPDDVESAASAHAVGGLLADRKIRIQHPVLPGPTLLPAGVSPTTELTEELLSLAVQSSEYSRFRLDPRFAPNVAADLYIQWLKNSLAGQGAKEVLMYQAQPNSSATGILIMGVTANRAEMVILAVDAASRGQGIGSTLIDAARRRARQWGLPALQLVTQANNPACQLYAREGFLSEHEEHVYHLWL